MWCLCLWLSSVILFSPHGPESKYCIKKLECDATECFETRGSPDPVCTSSQETEHCSIGGKNIKLRCDAALSCKCNGQDLIDLDGMPGYAAKDQSSISMKLEHSSEEAFGQEGDPKTPEVPERSNTSRIKSSGLLMLLMLLMALLFLID